MKQAIVSWSSGKDSAFALSELLTRGEYDVRELFTTVQDTHARVATHGVREELLDQQAAALGIPLAKIPIPWPCSNVVYEQRLSEYMGRKQAEGVTHAAFGDLFLADIRQYRDAHMATIGMQTLYPLWLRNTTQLAEEMIESGQKAILVCVDTRHLPAAFAGREFDARLLADLPQAVDPCGENGEFHTFVYASPIFYNNGGSLRITRGDTVTRGHVVYTDVLPA